MFKSLLAFRMAWCPLAHNKIKQYWAMYMLCHLSVYCTCFEISLMTMNYLESRCGLSCPWMCCFPWNPVFPTITYISVYFLTVQLNLMAAFIYINSRFGSFNSQDVGSSGDFPVEGSREMHGAPWNTGVLHCHLRLAAGGTVEEFSRGLWV